MKVKIVKTGNSEGIRIPKVYLQQTGIDQEVNLEVKDNQIIFELIKHKPRSGWYAAFARMADSGANRVLDKDVSFSQSSFDEFEWEW